MQRHEAAFFILTGTMAYTLNQSPPSWIAGSKHPIIFVVKDTDFANPKYKYICDIYVAVSYTHLTLPTILLV